jgi:glycosyltransferase involved in cell wall biosynthesis
VRIVNIDISDLYRARGRSGIQRVVREISAGLLRSSSESFTVQIIRFDYVKHVYLIIDPDAYLAFLLDDDTPLGMTLTKKFEDFGADDIFLDLDSAWNSPLKRPALYSRLKERGVTIVTFVHDTIPLDLPHVAHPNTVRNWSLFISAVYAFTDLALFASRSSEAKFDAYSSAFSVERTIATVVVREGADFAHTSPSLGELAAIEPFAAQPFMLFVSTIEPRKLHTVVLEAMETIHASAVDVHLVFVGRMGWHSETIMAAILGHPLFGVRVHWIDGPSDGLVNLLYQRSALTLYLTQAEGYGLPVAESLMRGKITIASENSSIYEVGEGFADYVHFNTPSEIAETALAYLTAPELARQRRDQIVSGFHRGSWATVVEAIAKIFTNLDRSAGISQLPVSDSYQWLLISNVPSSLARTIALIDAHVPWVKEYVVIAPANLREQIDSIPSAHPIRIIPEEKVLGSHLEEFRRSDHVRKNWMLRSLIPTLAEIEDEFVMLDDDNQPLTEIRIDTFLRPGPRYVGYYFYDMPRWPHRKTDFDYGLERTKRALIDLGAEVLSYASHQPQFINKGIFAEAIAAVGSVAPDASLDEWSVYFNFLASRYPFLVSKAPLVTLNWPGRESSWEQRVHPKQYFFENYYPRYALPSDAADREGSAAPEVIPDSRSVSRKIEDKREEERPYHRSTQLFLRSEAIIRELDMAHGSMVFESDGSYLVVSGVPHLITVGDGAPLRLRFGFARLGRTTRYEPGVFGRETQFCYRVLGRPVSFGVSVEDPVERADAGANGLFEMRFPPSETQLLPPGVYDLEFFAKFEGEEVRREGVSYRSRMIVVGEGERVPEVYARL